MLKPCKTMGTLESDTPHVASISTTTRFWQSLTWPPAWASSQPRSPTQRFSGNFWNGVCCVGGGGGGGSQLWFKVWFDPSGSELCTQHQWPKPCGRPEYALQFAYLHRVKGPRGP